MRHLNLTLFIFLCANLVVAQVNYTAHDTVTAYTSPFGYGTNVGYYPNWSAQELGDVAMGSEEKGIPGLGITSMRPALFEHFQETWGYDFRVPTFEYYKSLGAFDNVVFVGYPSEEHRDTTFYCPNFQSELFANMYTPIWDDGTDGTPYNDENYYAAYIYKTVTLYKEYVKFWEIWNEPDFSFTPNSTAQPDQPESWWNVPPDPCNFDIHAPIFHYIRLLRISYEVIKTVDPTAYVAIGGIGYPSFLDAVLRYTDHPEGIVNDTFPLTGGAYFDALSYHTYPHIDNSLRQWSNQVWGFVNKRHTDAAVEGVIHLKNRMETVLFEYGYDGATYPEKEWIITECNVPRVPINRGFGSDEVQRNFIIKALIESQKNGIQQFHVFTLGDKMEQEEVKNVYDEYEVMGLMDNMIDTKPFEAHPNDVGIAYKTTSDILFGKRYNHDATVALKLPEGIKGGVFSDTTGRDAYVFWAATQSDNSEEALQIIDLFEMTGIKQFEKRTWNYSSTRLSELVDARYITLTSAPIFLTTTAKGTPPNINDDPIDAPLQIYPNPASGNLNIVFKVEQDSDIDIVLVDPVGRIVKQFIDGEKFVTNQYVWTTDVEDVPQGLYYLKYYHNNQVNTVPLAVMRSY